MKFRKMSFMLCMLLVLLSGISAYAAGYELEVSLGEKGTSVELALYKVADIKNDEYVWDDEYKGVGVDLTKVSTAAETKAAAEKVYQWIQKKDLQPKAQGTTNEKGIVSFVADAGVYVLVKTSEEGSMAPVLFVLTGEDEEQTLALSPKYSVSDQPEAPKNPETPNNPVDRPNAKTGDQATIFLWVIILVVALAGIIVISKKNRNKK